MRRQQSSFSGIINLMKKTDQRGKIYIYHNQIQQRRFQLMNNQVQLISRTIVQILYYVGTPQVLVPKHIFSYIFIFSVLIDVYYNFPFAEINITKQFKQLPYFIRFYLTAAVFFTMQVIFTSLWLLTDKVDSQDLFFDLYLFALLLIYIAYALYKRRYHYLMTRFTVNDPKSTLPKFTDYYVEQLNYLAETSLTDQESQILLLQYVQSHKEKCDSVVCLCRSKALSIFNYEREHRLVIKNENDLYHQEEEVSLLNNLVKDMSYTKKIKSGSSAQMMKQDNFKRDKTVEAGASEIMQNDMEKIDRKEQKEKFQEFEIQNEEIIHDNNEGLVNNGQFYKFLTEILRGSLKHQQIMKSNQLFEQLSLKYISFLAKYRNNATRSYYELKSLTRKSSVSFYFKKLSRILADKIASMVELQQSAKMTNEQKTDKHNSSSDHIIKDLEVRLHKEINEDDSNSMLDITLYIEIEQLFQQWQGLALAYLIKKIEFWQRMGIGFKTIQQFQKWTEALMQELLKFQKNFNRAISKLNKAETTKNVIFYRMQSITAFCILNDFGVGIQNEQKIMDHYHLDRQKGDKEISVLKYLANEAVVLNISIMKHRGSILNKKTKKLAKFFGYDQNGFEKIVQVNQLMPAFTAIQHDDLIDRYLKRGYSNLIKSSQREVFVQMENGFIKQAQLELNTIFQQEDDFTMIGTLLNLDKQKDFIVFDVYGKILGMTQKLYLKVKEKYDLMNERNFILQEQMTRDKLLEKGNVFLLFPDIMRTMVKFIKQILKGETDLDPTISDLVVIDLMIQNKLNELVVARNYKCQLIVRQDLYEMMELYEIFLTEKLESNTMSKSSKFSSALLSMTKKSLREFGKPNILSLSSLAYQVKKQQKAENIPGLSLFNLQEIKFIQEFLLNQKIFSILKKKFKYYAKVNIKCHVLSQDRYKRKEEIYFSMEIVDQKIAKSMLYNLLQKKSIMQSLSSSKLKQTTTFTFDENKLSRRGLYKPQGTKNIFDETIETKKQSVRIEISQNLTIFHQNQSQHAIEEESEQQKEEELVQEQELSIINEPALEISGDESVPQMQMDDEDGGDNKQNLAEQKVTIPQVIVTEKEVSFSESSEEEQKKEKNSIQNKTKLNYHLFRRVSNRVGSWKDQAKEIRTEEMMEQQEQQKSSSDEDSDNQIEEEITLNSSNSNIKSQRQLLKQPLQERKEHDPDQVSHSSLTSKSYQSYGYSVIRQIIKDQTKLSILRNFKLLNFGIMIIFLIYFIAFAIVITQQNKILFDNIKSQKNIKFLHVKFESILYGALCHYTVNQIQIVPPTKSNLTNIFKGYIYTGYDQLPQLVEYCNPLLLTKSDLMVEVALIQKDTLSESLEDGSILKFMQMNMEYIQDLVNQLSLQNTIKLDSLYFLYHNHLTNSNLTQFLIKQNNVNIIQNQQSELNFILILSIIALISIFMPIPFILQINKQQNNLFSLILQVVGRIKCYQCKQQEQYVDKAIQILKQDDEQWSYFDFKNLFIMIDQEQREQDIAKEVNKQQRFIFSKITTRNITIYFALVLFYYFTYFITQYIYLNQYHANLSDFNNINYNLLNDHHQIISMMINSDVVKLQTLIPPQYSYLISKDIALVQNDINLGINIINQFIYSSLSRILGFSDHLDTKLLEQIFEKDLCKQNLNLSACNTTIGYQEQGLAGILSQINKFLTQTNQTSIDKTYFTSEEHLHLFYLGIPFINVPFDQVINYMSDLLDAYMTLFEQNLIFLWIFMGIIGLLVHSIIMTWYYHRQKDHILRHKLMLSLLPYSLLSDPSTMHLLKRLQDK